MPVPYFVAGFYTLGSGRQAADGVVLTAGQHVVQLPMGDLSVVRPAGPYLGGVPINYLRFLPFTPRPVVMTTNMTFVAVFAPAPVPTLGIAAQSGPAAIRLFWSATGYSLEVAESLTGTWRAEGTAPVVTGGQNQVVVAPAGAMKYHRLRKP